MSLLSSRGLRNMLIGGGQRVLYKMDKVRADGEKGLEELKIANEEVNKEVTDLKGIYDTALQVGGNVGGGTFANYIFSTEDIEYIAGLNSLKPDDRNEQFAVLKSNFNKLTDEQKESYTDYTKKAEQLFAQDVNRSKIDNGLKIKNNIGENTTNYLSRTLFSTPKDIKQKQEQLVEFDPPELTAPAITKGGFEAISPVPLNIKIDQDDILGYLKNSIEAMGFTTDDNRELKESFESDYNILINPQADVQQKTAVINKYYNTVLQNKIPITPITMAGNQDVVSSADVMDMNEDEDPTYTETPS